MASESPDVSSSRRTTSMSSTVRERVKPLDEGVWEDVSEYFQGARDEMEVGELLHLESFNLHVAMSAIELMDPKMDIGVGEVRNASETVLPSHLSDSQVINIMDELLACEMSWLDAHTLPQTVFSCVYTQRMYEIPRFELFSFIRVQLATMDSILGLVLDEKVADDEDFVASTYGFNLRPLCSDPPEDDHAILRKILQKIDDRPVEEAKGADSLADAITLRVHIQAELYKAIQCMSGLSFEHPLQEAPQLLSSLQDLVSKLEACPHRLDVDKELIQRIFDPSINRHLMTSSPPRTAPLFDSTASVRYLQRLLSEWKELVSLEDITLPRDMKQTSESASRRCSLQVAMHAVEMFSTTLIPTALTRSIMSRIIVPEYASALFTQDDADFIRLFITDMGLTDSMITPAVMTMLSTARGGTVDIFKCFCRNRSRQRRQALRLLRWWDQFGFLASPKRSDDESANADSGKELEQTEKNGSSRKVARAAPDGGRLNSLEKGEAVNALFATKSPLQIIAFELTARLMVHHWLLGFECELYQEYEYASIFFYVGYVLTTMANATTFLAEKSEQGASLHPLRFALYIMDEARLWMCRALHSALEALSRGAQWQYSSSRPLSCPESEVATFGSEKLWYEQRFGVVQAMVNGPVHADYDSFLSFKKVHEESLLGSNNEKDLTSLLLQDAANGFLAARRILERARKTAQLYSSNKVSDEIMQIARVAVENSLTLSRLLRTVDQPTAQSKGAKYAINFKFARHRHFPVIEVKPL